MAVGSARRRLTWLALAGALVAGLLTTAMRIGLPSDGARVPFYDPAWTADGVRIDPIDDPALGLRAGDLVVAVAGRPIEAWVRAALDPGVERPGDGGRYALRRGGEAIEADVTWAPPAVGATLLEGWSVVVFSLATVAIAAWVLRRRPAEPAATALALAAAGIAGSSVPWFLGATVSDVVRGGPFLAHALVTGPLYMVTWPAGIHLALVFPAPAAALRGRPWLIPAVYLAALAAYGSLLLVAALGSPNALAWVAAWPQLQLLIVVPALALILGLFVVRYRRTSDPAVRARTRLATLGIAGTVALALVTYMGPTLVLGSPLLPTAAIGLLSLPVPLAIAWAIVHDRLFDIEVAISRALVYGGLTLGVIVVYLATVGALTVAIGGPPNYGASLLATGVAALIALPLRDGLQRVVARLLYGQRDEPWEVMRRLGVRLEWATDPELAFPAVVDTLADALRLPYVRLEVLDEVGRATVVAEHGSAGDRPAPPVPDGPSGPSSPAAPAMRPAEAVELVHGGDRVGTLVLGLRSGERAFGVRERALLHDLARQAGAAIHAQRLRDDLARSRERLVIAREEERRRLRRDLHDGLGPALAAVAMRADAAAAQLEERPDRARDELETLSGEIRDVIADVRRLVDGLRPPALDQLGLAGAIREQAERLGAPGEHGSGPAIAVESRPDPLPELPAAVEVAAYRIAVEALTNAVRHAGARRCGIQLTAADALTVEVTDDGRGHGGARRSGTGLESMRERVAELGGEFSLAPGDGGGTRVLARLPLGSPAGR